MTGVTTMAGVTSQELKKVTNKNAGRGASSDGFEKQLKLTVFTYAPRHVRIISACFPKLLKADHSYLLLSKLT